MIFGDGRPSFPIEPLQTPFTALCEARPRQRLRLDVRFASFEIMDDNLS